MIISASRRTDIPAFYSEWLMNRIRAGVVKTKNPFNPKQVREISLRPEDVDCFVFWTKDPAPLLPELCTLDRMDYSYYFQFTLTPYGMELERNLRPKADIIDTFQVLSRQLGPHRVIWRYDPIILNDNWGIPDHAAAFEKMCRQLSPFTRRVIISFVDLYKKVRTDQIREITADEMTELAGQFAGIAARYGLCVCACCETVDLSRVGIWKSACIDKTLIEQITGWPVIAKADPNQRPGCGCCQSVDIGVYNTCGNGCVYCYANHSTSGVQRNRQRHDSKGEFLII